MTLRLRWKILLITVLPMATLALAMVWMVNRTISRQVDLNLREDLTRSAAVFENLVAARAEELSVAGSVIVGDPKFFSVLTLPTTHKDPQFRATVAGVARDFNAVIQADLFEVLDTRGELLASVGRDASTAAGRPAVIASALAGASGTAILTAPDAHFQVTVTPVLVGGRLVGVLLLGVRVGQELAERLRTLTRSDVTFLSQGTVTGSTLEQTGDRGRVGQAVERLEREQGSLPNDGRVFEVAGERHAYLTLARPIPRSRHGDRQYYVMQRALDIETAFLREMQTALGELALVAVLVVLVAGALISHGITWPVRRLVTAAEEMEKGNYDFPLQVRRRDEIGSLASRFDEMRRRQRVYVGSLEQLARMKSEFISVASHELRTPISIISGYQELMLGGMMGPVSEQQREALEGMGRGVEALVRIAENATRMAQIEGGRMVLSPSETDVRETLEQAVEAAVAAGRSRRVEVHVEADPRLGTAWLDAPRLALAFEHLVGNAIRFTPDGGRVVVRGRRVPDAVILEVRDNGVGIPADKLESLFQSSLILRDSMNHHSSSTLEFNSAGMGLGLPVARGIVEAHGGTLQVQSEVGRGTVVTVRLPMGEARLQKAA